jgi:PhoPQ-activated pathogenicity-related protein
MATLEQRNKAIVAKYFDEYWVKGNVDIVDELCSDDFLISYPNHGHHHGKEGAKKMLSEFMEVAQPPPKGMRSAYLMGKY